MPLWVALAGALLAALALTVSAGQRADALTNCSVTHDALDSEEQAFLGLINQYRAQNGLGALTISTNLNRAAAWMVEDMATNRYFSHTDSLGRAPFQRAIDCGYPTGAGENLAAGTSWSSAQAAFDAWRASPGHNQNMLTGFYRQIGIARFHLAGSPFGWYWATNFGTMDDGTGGGGASQPTSTPTNTPAPPTATPTPTRTPVPPTATPTPTPWANPTQPPATPTPPPPPPPPPPTSTPPPSTGQQGGLPPAPPPTATPTPPPKTVTPKATATPSPAATPKNTPTPRPKTPPSLSLSPGANLVAWPGGKASPAQVFGGNPTVAAVYEWDPQAGVWKRFIPGMPNYLNTLTTLENGAAYWVIARGQASIAVR
jgi:uncharacterized protein YkwD